jgi:glutamate synthase (NADPH/NADH) large chain
LVEDHAAATGSVLARALLDDWAQSLGAFWQIVPREMLARLPQPLTAEPTTRGRPRRRA